MARIDIKSSNTGGGGSGGNLQLLAGASMSATLTSVSDTSNTTSPLKLSTTAVQVLSPLRITTSDASGFYIDAEDSATNNRFSVKRDPSSQLVTIDFASNPAGSTTNVGAVRTYVDGVNLSEVMTFREDGNVGVGTTTPQAKLDVRTTDGFGSVQLYSNNDSSLPLRLFRSNNGVVGINTLSSGGTIDSPSNRASLGALTRVTGNAYVDGAYRALARMEYYLDAIPTAGVAPCSIRFLTVDASSSTYSINERMGITSDGNVQINDSIVNNRNAKLFIKGSGSTSATTSLLVQNSSGTELLKVQDDGSTSMGTGNAKFISLNSSNANFIRAATTYLDSPSGYFGSFVYNGFQIGNGSSAPNASAIIDATSTTQGFLPPRMTNAQRAAITSPAIGLMVYCTDAVEGVYVYKSTGWTFVA